MNWEATWLELTRLLNIMWGVWFGLGAIKNYGVSTRDAFCYALITVIAIYNVIRLYKEV